MTTSISTSQRLTACLSATICAMSMVATPASAGDWVMAAGSEEGRSGAIVPWGFAQLLVENQPWSAPVEGLQAPPLQGFNGATLAGDVDGVDVTLRRARLGLRGNVPGMADRLGMLVAIEAGENGLTRGRGIVVVDASVSVRLVESLRLRLGQFKLPTADEAIENNPSAAATTSFSPYVTALLIESDVVNGKVIGPASSLRDVGAQLFDAVDLWSNDSLGLELSWAAMASMGRPAHQMAKLSPEPIDWSAGVDAAFTQLSTVAERGPELTGRLQLSLLLDPASKKKPTRDEISAWVWSQHGSRAVDADIVSRRRSGLGAQLKTHGLRLRAEAVLAEGAIFQPAVFVGQPATVVADGVANGGSLDVSVARIADFKLDPFVIDASLDWLQRNPGDPVAERTLQALTLGAQWKLMNKGSTSLRLISNVVLRRLLVGADAPKDAAVIADALSPTVSAQLNLTF